MPAPAVPRLNRFQVALKALSQLGPRALSLYALYQLGLRSGHYRRMTGPRLLQQVRRDLQTHPQVHLSTGLFQLPSQHDLSAILGEAGRISLLEEADEIVQGKVRLFGAQPVPLQLAPPTPLSHWTIHASRMQGQQDIKFTWEPARFGWAIVLARAYHLTSDQRYAAAFWEYTERFLAANPPFDGPNWVSAQEVALRLISLTFAFQVFASSPHTTSARSSLLLEAVTMHAIRIPLTWPYAHAQDNNHLLSEAAGLVTAALALPDHPQASRWSRLGWRWFNRALLSQFDGDGAYTQHSANYHRLALHLALWLDCLLRAHVGHAVSLPTSEPVGHAVSLPTSDPVRQAVSLSTSDPVGHAVSLPTSDPVGHAVSLPTSDPVGQAVSSPTSDPVGQAVSLSTSDPVGHAVSLSTSDPVGHAVSLSTSEPDPPDTLPHSLPRSTLHRLSSASRWLLEIHDPHTGRLPNFGPNDGALLLPFSTCPIDDYRPVLQSASAAFLSQLPFPPGPWDESLLWLGLSQHVGHAVSLPASSSSVGPAVSLPASTPSPSRTPHTLRSPDGLSWAYLRLARFTSRPGHADQLHLDLWWRGLNLAQDAGTYLYNAPPPWDNPLAGSAYHNTLTVDGLDQMTPAGRFLFLDWSKPRLVSQDDRSITAEHDGYRRLGLLHRRTVSISGPGVWRIDDSLLPLTGSPPSPHTACLHWLLPDWQYSLVADQPQGDNPLSISLHLETPHGRVVITLSGETSQLQLSRGGELLAGSGPVKPAWGWSSPTYGVKIPALSLRLFQAGPPPTTFTTLFTLPH